MSEGRWGVHQLVSLYRALYFSASAFDIAPKMSCCMAHRIKACSDIKVGDKLIACRDVVVCLFKSSVRRT